MSDAKTPATEMTDCYRCGGQGGEQMDDGWLACYCCCETGKVPAAAYEAEMADRAAAKLAEETRLQEIAAHTAAYRASLATEAERDQFDADCAEAEWENRCGA